MDKHTLKCIIVELKNDNKTFQEVSDILNEKYNVKMSRQAVCGMYNRIISNKQMTKNIDLLIATNDMINYYSLGYGSKKIKEILSKQDVNLSIGIIDKTLNEELVHINNIKSDMISKVVELIKRNSDIDTIKNSLKYKSIEPTSIVLNELIDEASTEILKSRAVDLMVKLINITDNRDLAKKVASKHNFNITCKEINEALNK